MVIVIVIVIIIIIIIIIIIFINLPFITSFYHYPHGI